MPVKFTRDNNFLLCGLTGQILGQIKMQKAFLAQESF